MGKSLGSDHNIIFFVKIMKIFKQQCFVLLQQNNIHLPMNLVLNRSSAGKLFRKCHFLKYVIHLLLLHTQ